MSTNDHKQAIQQMQEGERDFGVLNTVKTLHKKVLNNDLVTEFDVFSVPVKLTLKGSEVYQTLCGGLMHLLILGSCIAITIFILFPDGIQLQSEISITTVPSTQNQGSYTFFDNTDQIISWRGLEKDWFDQIIGYTDISNFSTYKAYLQDSENETVELEISTDCVTEGAEFCIRNSLVNSKATFSGNFYNPDVYSQHFVLENFWCDWITDPDCPFPYIYAVEIKMTNFYKKKGGAMVPVTNRIITNWFNRQYALNVTEQIYSSNSKFFGHLSNLLPFSKHTFLFSDVVEAQDIIDPTLELISIVPNNTMEFAQVKITPCGITRQINENFDDISQILLFFLSVKETFYIVIFFIFIKHYNRNSGLLEVADSLFYIDDPKTKKKYDFRTGYQVFFACLLYNHPLYNFMNFILTKIGTTLEEALPKKAICAIKLMKKTEEILQENSFYGNLNELSSLETEASRKIKLIEDNENDEGDENELEFFPILPNDSEIVRKQKELKRDAFEQFCEANQYISAGRKNHVYRVITERKLRHMLVHDMQREFMEFVRNMRIQKTNDVYQEVPDGEISEIMVAVHDTSNNQLTAHNFIRT